VGRAGGPTLTAAAGVAAVCFAIDHCSLALVGIHAAQRGRRFEALESSRQGGVNLTAKLSKNLQSAREPCCICRG